jgi:putative Ca2+/H+ antiporter (TMEM165/GDT1 family)
MSAVLASFLVMVLAEGGDKTQLATVALGARHAAPSAVTLGTTAGMRVAEPAAISPRRFL